MGASIIGWGAAMPEEVITNADFAKRLDTSDEWIVERTGIRERHIGGSTGALAIEAGRAALKEAGVDGESVSILILATTTPDKAVPATSSMVHDALGLSGGAFDLNAACAGFAYAMVTANGLLTKTGQRALVIGADALSKVTDFEDRATAVLFGDGAGAVVIERTDGPELILGFDLGVDGDATSILYADHGGFIKMEGREVYRRAVRAELISINKVLEDTKLTVDDIALFIPHQANLRIIEAVNERIGMPMEKTMVVLDRTGNTSAASIPLALAEAANQGRLKEGDLILLAGFGAGMTWASTVVRWGTEGVVTK